MLCEQGLQEREHLFLKFNLRIRQNNHNDNETITLFLVMWAVKTRPIILDFSHNNP